MGTYMVKIYHSDEFNQFSLLHLNVLTSLLHIYSKLFQQNRFIGHQIMVKIQTEMIQYQMCLWYSLNEWSIKEHKLPLIS